MSEQRGQTATEYMGVLLIVAATLFLIARTDVPRTLRDGIVREVCLALNEEDDCPPTAAEKERRAQVRARRAARRDSDGDHVPDAVERRYGTNVRLRDSDGDGVSDAVELRRRVRMRPG